MLKLLRTFANREKVAKREYKQAGFLPYISHWNENTVLLTGNRLMKVIRIGGFSFETADDEDLDARKNIRNLLYKGMATSDISFSFNIMRRKQKIYPDDYASVDMPEGFALYLDKKWVDKHRNVDAYVNELYISLIKKAKNLNIMSGLDTIISMISKNNQNSDYELSMREALEELEEGASRVINSLKDYSPEELGVESENGVAYSQIAEYLGRIVNCGEISKFPLSTSNLSSQISSHRLYFGKRSIEVKLPTGESKYAGVVSIKEYGPKTWVSMLDSLLQLPFEFIISQSFTFANRQRAIGQMQLQQNRMIQAGDKAVSQIEEINVALDMAMSGGIGFGLHHLTALCMAEDPKTLENVLSIIAVELTNTGGVAVREKVNMEPAFWAQVPGNNEFIVRKSTINTLNLASLNSFHNYPVGKQKNNHWGDAVTVLDTTSGTPFYFNFHVRDVGHTTIIGPTGAGKTVLMNFLCAQAQKYKCRLFFFDKDRGAEIFIRALGGSYTLIDPGSVCGFNPLTLEDTGENRTFLMDWLKQLVSTNGETVSSEDVHYLSNALSGNYKLDPKDRRLSNIAPFLGLGGPGSLAGRIGMWVGKGSHGKVFDNEKDVIDFGNSNIFGFEMAELLKDSAALGPVLSYIFHKINISLDGTPTMIVLDEAWALIDNPIFAPKIKDWLKVLRKLNTFVIFATQSVEDASKSSISDTLIQQTATQIFLPNLKATSVYRTTFMLSQREFDLIKSTDPSTRFFLVKQGNDSVIARVDLRGMSDVISILSGRADTVGVLDEIRKTHGEDPNVWIPIFHKKVQEMQEQ
ncbi:MAG: VirB4 family type IV secretion/conjugal transfer ATPase [Rickettsiales bacterium]